MEKSSKTEPAKTWLVFDMSNLAYRAVYAHGHLSQGTTPTGIQYGILRDIKTLKAKFMATNLVFCFDWGPTLRQQEFPWYKANRNKDPERLEVAKKVRIALGKLRKKDLKSVGFRNMVRQEGFEADDMMALVCSVTPFKDNVVLVSGDKDLYQLLSPRVIVYHPSQKKEVTKESFKDEYGIEPFSWSLVKALGGCTSDGVPGLKGVGEKTALRYVRGDKGHKEKLIGKVAKNRKKISNFMRVTTIPYPGTSPVVLKKDRYSHAAWEELLDGYGMKSLKETK